MFSTTIVLNPLFLLLLFHSAIHNGRLSMSALSGWRWGLKAATVRVGLWPCASQWSPPSGQKGLQRSTWVGIVSQIKITAHSFHHQLSKCLIPAWPGFENQHKTYALILCLIAFILLQLAHRWQFRLALLRDDRLVMEEGGFFSCLVPPQERC